MEVTRSGESGPIARNSAVEGGRKQEAGHVQTPSPQVGRVLKQVLEIRHKHGTVTQKHVREQLYLVTLPV